MKGVLPMGASVQDLNTAQNTGRASIPLLATKLSIPIPRGTLVHRPRLTDPLTRNERHPLTLVVAPAGWGKSSLLSAWCRPPQATPDASVAVGWLSLDAGDNDPSRFLLYVAAALETVEPGLGDSVRTLLHSPQPTPLEMALTLLLNDVSACARSITLILDDYHLIESLAVHNVLTFLLDHLPPNLRLVISTRLDPPLPLSRMRVRGQLLELRAHDLRFTCEETAAFLNEIMGLDLPTEAVARLEARTEGWVAGLQLAALSLRGRTNPSEFLDSFTGSNRYIVDYLFEEVLSRQPEEVQTFLQETSFLSRLCGPLCDAVTGQNVGQALLEQSDSANLFLIPLDEERRWYRYHHLFADVLQARLALQGREKLNELHRRAAVWHDTQGLGEEAIHHALSSGRMDLAADYVDRYSDGTWRRGEQVTLDGWLRALPRELILARPKLCVAQGAIYIYTLQTAAIESLLDVCRPTELSDDPETRDVQGRLLALEGFLRRMQGRYAEARQITQRALPCLAEQNARWRAVTMLNLGVLYFEDGNLPGTIEAFIEANRLAQIGEDLVTVLISYCGLAESREEQGALQEASRLYQSALDYLAERRLQRFPHALWLYCGLGRLHYEWNDLPNAEAMLRIGLDHHLPGFVNACYLEMLKLKKTQGDFEGVEALLDQMKAQTIQVGIFSITELVAMSEIQATPELDAKVSDWLIAYEARNDGTAPPRLPFTFPYVPYRERETLIWARASLARGESERVQVRLTELLDMLVRQGRHGRAVEVRALLASIHQLEGRTEQAITVLTPALSLAATEGYTRAFLDAGRSLVPVLRQAAAQGIEPACVARLLEAYRSEGLLPAAQPEDNGTPLAEPLSERELEVLRLVAAGLSNPEIADHLFLSVGTIKRHVYNIYGKLDVTGRVEAATRARELNLL